MSGSIGSSKGGGSNKVRVPGWLSPLVNQGVATAGTALGGLEDRLTGSGDDLVAPFNIQQLLAQALGTDRALGGGDFFPVSQDTFLDTARGIGLDEFIPSGSLDALNSFTGSDGLDFLDPRLMEAIGLASPDNAIAGTDLLNRLGSTTIPSAVTDRVSGIDGVDTSFLENLLNGGSLNPSARTALEATAGGDFLFGGEGFDAALNAAMNDIVPEVRSLFAGQGGVGAASGGLAETAIAEAGLDAFAGLFSQERRNQLGAADTLADLGLADRSQTASIAQSIAGLDLSSDQLGLDAANLLGNLNLADLSRQTDVGTALANIDLSGNDQALNTVNLFGGLQEGADGRGLAAADILAGLGVGERTNQLDAARLLPDIATADVDLLDRVGTTRQALDQARINAPIDALLQLLTASLGVAPTSAFLGSKTSDSRRGFSLGFGDD